MPEDRAREVYVRCYQHSKPLMVSGTRPSRHPAPQQYRCIRPAFRLCEDKHGKKKAHNEEANGESNYRAVIYHILNPATLTGYS